MSVYLVAVVRITNPEVFEQARRAASSATGEYGAKFLARGSRGVAERLLEVIEGELSPDHITVIEYPSIEHARAWLASEEYKSTRARREGAADFNLFLLPAVAG